MKTGIDEDGQQVVGSTIKQDEEEGGEHGMERWGTKEIELLKVHQRLRSGWP